MSGDFDWALTADRSVVLHVDFLTEVRAVTNYAVVLMVLDEGEYRQIIEGWQR